MAGPVLTIKYNGVEIQDHVLYESCRFESQMAAIPGTFEMLVLDKTQTLDFITGKKIEVALNGVALWGGFLTVVGRKFAFPVVDTVNRAPADVKERLWVLQGVDYNILFDKLVLRRVEDYLHAIPNVSVGHTDYYLISTLLASYLDKPGWLTSHIENTEVHNPDLVWAWQTQGSTWRSQMEDIAAGKGQIWYIDATGELQWRSLESGGNAWGFSDVPDGSTYIGFRELEASEDGSGMVNDALVWGGDAFTGANPTGSGGGRTIFSRYQNSASQTAHGRWQWSEPHFGDPNFASQALLDLRSSRIVDGPPGSSLVFATSGLKNPAWNVRLTWFDNDIPTGAEFLKPGHYVNMVFNVLGIGGLPLELTLPCRTITMTFPVLQKEGATSKPAVRFDGVFAIELNDSATLWQAILNARAKIQYKPKVITATNDSSETHYDSYGQFIPTPAANGSAHVFTVKFGYIRGSSALYVDGLRQSLGNAPGVNDYQESNPVAGEFTITVAPATGKKIYIECRTLDGAV